MPTNSAEQVREFYRKQGEERERERIIELLEPTAKSCDNGNCDCPSLSSVIALIKGENK